MNSDVELYRGRKLWYHKILLEELSYISILLKEWNIPFWITAGTLLGAARNKHIIPWDDDIDVGIFLSDFERFSNLKSRVIQDGFTLKLSERISRLFFSEIKSHPDIPVIKFHVDFFTHRIENLRVINTYIPRHYIFLSDFQELGKIEFEGNRYPCPKNYFDYLSRTYGEDWKIPHPCKHDISYIESFDPTNQDILDEIKKYELRKK